MSESSQKRSEEFLKICDQFQLGGLTTEASHPVTARLSETAKQDIGAALKLLFDVDDDVLHTYRQFVDSGLAANMQQAVLRSLRQGGKLFFTGCGSTGRLSIQLVSIWRDFWQRQRARGLACRPAPEEFERRAWSVMAGGDFALIKAVEGFEDFTAFGKKQIADLGVAANDVVFAITEGGETSFVIGTAWKGVEMGAKVYFVYNNPDEVLCRSVTRSREVIEDKRIEKINLTTGPMAITGSTRMQATSIQLCVLLTVLEMALRDLMCELDPQGSGALDSASVPGTFLEKLSEMQAGLKSDAVLANLSRAVALEESVYRSGHKNSYFADVFGVDVLTDTTERSPTYCTPPFRKFDDRSATESWAYLFVAQSGTPQAWERIIKRRPVCVEWTESEIDDLVDLEKRPRVQETVSKISYAELMRFKVGLDGLPYRPLGPGDSAVGILSQGEVELLFEPAGFHRAQLDAARKSGARTGVIFVGNRDSLAKFNEFTAHWDPGAVAVPVPAPSTDFLLDGVTRVGVKMLLNALSTCTMVRLGRVMGNYMIWVVPSNLKLIDRSTRYIQKLTGLEYQRANQLLFEVIEYVEPRMKADRAYPPVVGVSVMRARHGVGNEEAEQRLASEL
jgi:N-acetylmuramic acid 6-phosphate etherase